LLLSALFLGSVAPAFAQQFQNLDFQEAGLFVPTNQPAGFIDPALAFPGWTVGGGGPGAFSLSTFYNLTTLSGSGISLFYWGQGHPDILDPYFISLEFHGFGAPPTLSQTGLVPTNAKSIILDSDAIPRNITVLLNGVAVPMYATGGMLVGDVSAFAGELAQLTFSMPGGVSSATNQINDVYDIYSVSFSASPVPEPGSLALVGLGSLLLVRRAIRKSGPKGQ
jgi:hypothetical protein